MFPVARPKPGETEEDLLLQQQQFLQSKPAPAATVIKKPDKRPAAHGDCTDPTALAPTPSTSRDIVDLGGLPGQFSHTSAAPPIKRSKFKQEREKKWNIPSDITPEEKIEAHDSHVSKILTEIVERDIKNTPVYYPKGSTMHGFPTAPHRGSTEAVKTGSQKKSIFAQQFACGQAGEFGLKAKSPPVHSTMLAEEMLHIQGADTGTSRMVSGTGLSTEDGAKEAVKIHQENMGKLASMSESQILEEQQKLLQSLDPSLIAFFKAKKDSHVTSRMEIDKGHKSEEEQSPVMKTVPQTDDVLHAELPIKPDKRWVNMDKVEATKLEWTKELPPPPKAEILKTGGPARFDFQGLLLAVDSDVPTRDGLHHHSNEPERAGYTLEELFLLARSANMQQRTLALTSIARIIHKARDGRLHSGVEQAVVPALLQGGLVFLLRWALDDSTDSIITAAVLGIHALLVCRQDEDAADQIFWWFQGSSIPALCPKEHKESIKEQQEEEDEEPNTDASVLRDDVIKGLLQMQMLPRLRYILEVWRPGATVVIQVLQILTRVARHSTQSAYMVIQCPRLLDTIFREFLPTTWTPLEDDCPLANVHGYPVPEALKLVRVLSAAGRNMAAHLVSKYWLMTCISRYIVENPSDLQLPISVATNLQLESLRAWKVISTYGLASESFSELFPVLTKLLQGLPTLYHLSNPVLLQWGQAFLALLESVVELAASTHKLSTESRQGYGSSNVAPVTPEINWSHVTGLFRPVEMCLQNSLKEFVDIYPTKKHDLTFASCCLNFTATFISKMDSQPGYNAVEWLDHLEKLASSCLEPCLSSVAFNRVLNVAREHSPLLWVANPGRREVPPSLPELGSLVSDDGALCPLLKESSTLHFLLSLVRLLTAIGKTHKALAEKLYPHVLGAEDLKLYLRKSCQVKRTTTAANFFVRFDNLLQYQLIQMGRLQPKTCDVQLLHKVALFLLSRVHRGDEHVAHDLLSTVIFNADFVRDLLSIETGALSDLERLQLTGHSTTIGSATRKTVVATGEQLIHDITDHLASMRGSYLSCAARFVTDVDRSRARLLTIPHLTENLLLGPVGELVAPVDWPFVPLVDLYNCTSRGVGGQQEFVSSQLVAMVTDALRFVYMLERWRPDVLDCVTHVTKLSRLMCTFLAGSDLFLDTSIHMHLEAIYKLYCRPVFLERMDFTKKVPGLTSFYDFFVLFLLQFEAVSFGDHLFASFLLLPLQQRHSVQLRKVIWTEHDSILRTLSIPLKEIMVPIENFLHPEETNIELIRLYYQALYSGTVMPQRSPFLYLVAVHHVNRFIYTEGAAHKKLRMAMLKQISTCAYKSVEHDIIYYKMTDLGLPSGLDHYSELPSHRQAFLQEARDTQPS